MNDYKIVIGYGYDYEEALKFKEMFLESLAQYSDIKDVEVFQIGATIGVHTGPYPIGVGLIRRYDR